MLECIARRIAPSEWRHYRDLRLRALQDAPEAFGTTYADVAYKPNEFWQSRISNLPAHSELPLFAEMGGDRVGLSWGRIERPETKEAYLFHMWVAPEHRGNGVGRLLIDAVVAWARAHGASTLHLSVACGNIPARRLYESAGFRAIGQPEPMRPGSNLLEQSMQREIA